jgi:tryptophan 2,3-dioxygenase
MPNTTRVVKAETTERRCVSMTQDVTYGSYLKLDSLLSSQHPLTDEHDELLFIIIHQVYELWFTQILHETVEMQARLERADGPGALSTMRRVAKILKTMVGQLDVLETMTPRQFASFRSALGTSSGFQSSQFRQLEAVMGRRDFGQGNDVDPQLEAVIRRRTVLDSLLTFLSLSGYEVPSGVLERDPANVLPRSLEIDELFSSAYDDVTSLAPQLFESLVDIDEGVQEWRYRHVKMVERVIGAKIGTGGSAGADYLRSTLFRPSFPELWDVRSI